eukprot:273813_1
MLTTWFNVILIFSAIFFSPPVQAFLQTSQIRTSSSSLERTCGLGHSDEFILAFGSPKSTNAMRRMNTFLRIANDPTMFMAESDDLLMRVYFKIKSEVKATDVVCSLQSYVASFPFAAVLPVQPMKYVPREDGPGVDISFLRKKTMDKGAIDGGIHFIISSEKDGELIRLDARREAEGQTISKAFSEGLIIKTFVSGLLDEEGGRVGINKDELVSMVDVEKIIHKWM